MNTLPDKLKPTAPPIASNKKLETDEPVVDDAQLVESMRSMGAVTVTERYLKDLEKIGIAAKTTGTLKLGRGQALITQNRVEELSGIIVEAARKEMTRKCRGKLKMADAKRLCMFATALSTLSKASTESQRLMLEIEEAKPGGATDDDIPPVKSFAPGAEIRPIQIAAQNVNISAPQAAEQKKS